MRGGWRRMSADGSLDRSAIEAASACDHASSKLASGSHDHRPRVVAGAVVRPVLGHLRDLARQASSHPPT
jgi:hypothetical protein